MFVLYAFQSKSDTKIHSEIENENILFLFPSGLNYILSTKSYLLKNILVESFSVCYLEMTLLVKVCLYSH